MTKVVCVCLFARHSVQAETRNKKPRRDDEARKLSIKEMEHQRRRSRLVLAQFRKLRAGSGMQTRKWVRNEGFARCAILGVECSRSARKERDRRIRNTMIVLVNARSQELSRVDLLQKIKRELAVQSLYFFHPL